MESKLGETGSRPVFLPGVWRMAVPGSREWESELCSRDTDATGSLWSLEGK